MLRRRLSALLGLITVIPLTVVTAAAASPSAAAAASGLTVTSATVQTVAPAETRPMAEDCYTGRSADNCGYGIVEFTLTGFDAYGGIPDCETEYTEACELFSTEITETAGTRIDVAVRCAGQRLPRVRTVQVVTDAGQLQWAAEVGPWNRVDSDTARLKAHFTLPSPDSLRACAPGTPVTFLGAVARRVTVGWTSGTGSVPDGHASLSGTYRFASRR